MDKATRNKVISKMPYGLYIVGTSTEGGATTIIANWVSQVSFDPPLLSIALEDDSEMRTHVEYAKYFSVNMLPIGSTQFAKPFLKKSKQSNIKLNDKEINLSKHGMPFLKDAAASLECKVVNSIRTGDHVLFIGEIVDGVLRSDSEILTLKETGWKYNR